MRRCLGLLGAVMLAVVLAAGVSPAQGQLGRLKDKIKQKAEEKADQKIDEKIDQGIDAAVEGSEEAADSTEAAKTPAAQAAPGAPAAGGSAAAEDMTLYTKYDFVPGDKVVFYDDLAGEEIGEFPSRWNLDRGVFEVVRRGNRNYIMCTDAGIIAPRIASGALPQRYTVEMDFVAAGPGQAGHWFHLEWVDAEGQLIGRFAIRNGQQTELTLMDKQVASKDLPVELAAGIHTMRAMVTKGTFKCYIDHERVANVPAIEGFAPAAVRVFLDPWTEEAENPMLISGFRLAEGGKSLRDQLAEAGRIITHGILFDSGSAQIKAESYKTLADIGQLLTDDAGLRLSIEGHTDGDGSDESNLALSRQRAEAVRAWLVASAKIDAGRLECQGWGESKPIDVNTTPEGKANNRRVELVKL